MFNPFIQYEAKFLSGFRQKGVKVFVLQTYLRGRRQPGDAEPPYLLTHYTDIHLAQSHMAAIAHDPERRLLYMDRLNDFEELKHIGRPGAGMLVYMSFKIPNAELAARKQLDKKLRNYISFELQWRPSANTVVEFSLEFVFGEIYAVFRYGSKYHKVKFDEIENCEAYVL